jgi:uncharacterized membrane protein
MTAHKIYKVRMFNRCFAGCLLGTVLFMNLIPGVAWIGFIGVVFFMVRTSWASHCPHWDTYLT